MPAIVPMGGEHVPAAAAVLERRHRRHREAAPLLKPEDAASAVRAALGRDGAAGAVALEGDNLVAYMIGRPGQSTIWPPHVWVDEDAWGADDPEALRDLYAHLADGWAAGGSMMHLALVPATAEGLEPWYRLAFAQMQVYGIREPAEPASSVPPGLAVREGTNEDFAPVIDALGTAIAEHQARSPVFNGLTPHTRSELLEIWSVLEPGELLLVAERADRIVGHAWLIPSSRSFAVPEGALYLASAAVSAQERGAGVGVALTNRVLQAAADAGAPAVVADWRVANLLASRFWPARGFRPTFIRMMRLIGTG